MSRLRSVQEHLNRWMLAYVSLAIVAGLALGNVAAGWTKGNTGLIGGLTTTAVFVIINPMMVNVRFEALLRAGRNLRGIGIALAFNFVILYLRAAPRMRAWFAPRAPSEVGVAPRPA